MMGEAARLALLTMNNLPYAMFIVRFTGQIINVNDLASDFTGYSPEELQQMTIGKVLPGLDFGAERGKGRLGPDREIRMIRESELLRKDGGKVPVEVSVSEKMLHGTRQYLMIVRDITERRRAEEIIGAEGKPGLVIIDYRLPDMDGLDVMKGVLALRPGTKIIFISGDDSVQREALNVGANVFLKKPTDIKVITETISSLIKS